MSSTNQTATIGLSQYIGTDKPTYLSDYNGDMLKIDNAIAADRDSIATAQNKADGADGKADANAQAIATISDALNNTSNGLVKRVTDVEGDVNTIESLIGNGTPTTSDKTIIGAINELDSDVTAISSSLAALDEKYVVKNYDGIKNVVIDAVADTFDSFSTKVIAAVNELISLLASDELLIINSINVTGVGSFANDYDETFNSNSVYSSFIGHTAYCTQNLFTNLAMTLGGEHPRMGKYTVAFADGAIATLIKSNTDLISAFGVIACDIKYVIVHKI